MRVGELGVSDGGMFKCSKDHSEFREEHSKRHSKGTSPKRSKSHRMRSNLEVFTIKETQATCQGQFRNVTTCNLSFLYKKRCAAIRVCGGENLKLM